MRVFFRGLLCLLPLLPLLGICAPPDFGITGTWQGKDHFWTVTSEHLRVVAPGDKVGRDYTVACAEPLPGDEWTLNYATVQNYDIPYAEITLSIGEPQRAFEVTIESENNRAVVSVEVKRNEEFDRVGGGYMDGCGGNVHQVCIRYSAKQQRFAMTINGQAVDIKMVPLTLPTGPVSFRLKVPNGLDKEFCADILDFRVQPTVVFAADDAPLVGPAWNGWQTITKPAATAVPVEFEARMAALYQNPTLTDVGRAQLLAAVTLYERAQNGRVGDGAWGSIGTHIDYAGKQLRKETRDYGLGFLYPIAVASANDVQREQARSWVGAYFKLITSMRYNIPEQVLNMRRSELLDTQRTVSAAIAQRPNFSLDTALLRDVPTMPTEAKVALYTGMISEDTRPLNAYAWQLPDLAQASPTFTACIKSMFSEFGARRDTLFNQELDIPFAYAAYRMSPIDLPFTLTMADAMHDASIQVDLYEALQTSSVGARIPNLTGRIEKGLRTAITQGRRSHNDTSPVASYLRLANWYLAQGRPTDATAVVKEAFLHMAKEEDRSYFRDIRLIATFYRTIKSPEADAWAAKMNDAATTADADLTDHPDGLVAVAATSVAVRNLMQDGKIDAALAMIDKLDPDALPENIANCYAIVIYTLVKTNVPRALELLKRVPHVRQRDSLVAGIAPYLPVDQARAMLAEADPGPQKTAILGAVVPTIAKANMAEALALLKAMPPADRRTALLGIGATTPLHSTPELLTLTSECVAAYLVETKRYSRDARMSFFNGLAEQPPAALMALEPAFATDYDFYTRVMVFSMAKACGLQKDPLWQRFADSEWDYRATPIIWSSMVFKSALRQYQEAQAAK